MKRYCQTLDLKDNPELIAEYRRLHSPGGIWPEIPQDIREAGILNMEIYLLGTRLFMIAEIPSDVDWDTVMQKMAGLPRQAEWEAHVSVFQQALPGASSAEKWQIMERIFSLDSCLTSNS